MIRDQQPKNVGIIDVQAYFPSFYVDQSDLEIHDKVGKGKYTNGLGQLKMSIASDREDINSICLTVLDKLLTRNGIDRKLVGRLEVGTETFLDKSKSIKTYLMALFKDCNTDIEGVTTSNACYGGTNALFNTLNWVQSEAYDGRYGIVIMGDVAVYGKGNARPTGGCGSIALLIGPNAPLVVENIRSTYMNHVFDFFKPDPSKEYPVVDGAFSLDCYFKALESCYISYFDKVKAKGEATQLKDFDYFCFHSPFAKMVDKAFVNLINYDIKHTKNYTGLSGLSINKFSLSSEKNAELISSIVNSKDYKVDLKVHNELRKVLDKNHILANELHPSMTLSKNLGNTYVCSLYMNLLALLVNKNLILSGKKIFMFSYGSGCAASLFSIKVAGDISKIQERNHDVYSALDNRIKIEPLKFEEMMIKKEKLYLSSNYVPETDLNQLKDGTYFLTKVDEKWRRYYDKKINSTERRGEIAFNKLSNSNRSYNRRLVLIRNQLNSQQLN